MSSLVAHFHANRNGYFLRASVSSQTRRSLCEPAWLGKGDTIWLLMSSEKRKSKP